MVHADESTGTDRIPGDLHAVGTAFATAGDALWWRIAPPVLPRISHHGK
jgi:hypothetical protein